MTTQSERSTTWQGSDVRVRARLVPRFLWTTASIEVFLDQECILRTGGQMKFTGAHSAEFVHSGAKHTAELSWGSSGFSFSFPYQLRIDGAAIQASRVRIRNWPIGLLAALLVAAMISTLFYFVLSRFMGMVRR
jgi:hypothetical protein